MLVGNLKCDVMGADIRFGVNNIQITNDAQSRPKVSYTNGEGACELTCDHIAGCDANRGVSRASIPHEYITAYTHEFGYA